MDLFWKVPSSKEPVIYHYKCEIMGFSCIYFLVVAMWDNTGFLWLLLAQEIHSNFIDLTTELNRVFQSVWRQIAFSLKPFTWVKVVVKYKFTWCHNSLLCCCSLHQTWWCCYLPASNIWKRWGVYIYHYVYIYICKFLCGLFLHVCLCTCFQMFAWSI